MTTVAIAEKVRGAMLEKMVREALARAPGGTSVGGDWLLALASAVWESAEEAVKAQAVASIQGGPEAPSRAEAVERIIGEMFEPGSVTAEGARVAGLRCYDAGVGAQAALLGALAVVRLRMSDGTLDNARPSEVRSLAGYIRETVDVALRGAGIDPAKAVIMAHGYISRERPAGETS